MSSEDINMVKLILKGITNPDKNIRTEAVNKLQELRKNLGALTYCLLQIAQLPINSNEEQLIKTTSLVICRKILDTDDMEEWRNIDNNLKNQIKLKSLEIFINENQEVQKGKICDVITQIIDKVSDCDEDWEDLKNLSLNILNLNPNDENNIIQINSLLKLLTDGTGFLFDILKENFNKIIPYLITIFQSHFLKIKVSASNFISELITFSDKDEMKDLTPLIFNILQSTLECYTNNEEFYLKDLLQTLIEMCSVEPKIFKPHFQDLFILCRKIIEKKDFDEKIRELSFEVLINLIEEEPKILKKRKEDIKILFEIIFKYSLEMNKEIDNSWYNPTGNNYSEIDSIEEENVQFSEGLIERLIDAIGLEETKPLLNEIINNLINQNNWICKYIGLFSFSSLIPYVEDDMSSLEIGFNIIFSLTKNENPKVKFAAINCINKLCDHYNPNFQKKYINQVLPLLFEIIKNENILRIQCEIIDTLKRFIQFTTSENIMPYVTQLLDILFGLFIKDIPLILRKVVIECLLEIFSTIEEKSEPYAKKSFNIILKYFVELYKTKSNRILFGGLIECLTTIGPYIKEDFYKVVPDIVKCIIELVQEINFDEESSIRTDLQNSLERLLPILQSNFQELLPNLVQTVFTLIKLKPKMSISDNPEKEIDLSELLNENDKNENNKKNYNIETSFTEDFAESLSLLKTLIESLNKEFLPYVNEIENEILPLINNGSNQKIRTKASKILSCIICILNDNNQKKEKGILYIKTLINAIEKEIDNHTCQKMFSNLKKVIDNSGMILEKNELNELFNKIMKIFENLEKKRLNLISKKDKKNIKKKSPDDDSDDENLNELINEDIESIENIQSEIADVIGLLFKTHKPISDDIIKIILQNVLPKYINSTSNFELKMGLYITDDLIEYLGQEILNNVWNDLYNLITNLCKKDDCEIRQSASYGIGVFAKFTNNNFDNYCEGLLNALKEGMNFKYNEDNDDEYNFGLAFDNIIASFGKIMFYQFNSEIVKKYMNELINIWINNLPLKYDNTEGEQQHEWLCDMFLLKRELIPEKCYNQMFKNMIIIYNSKYSNIIINKKIVQIFDIVKNDNNLKNIVQQLYDTSEPKLKTKLEMLIK